MSRIKWNPSVRLIISDVDETVADIYVPAPAELCRELEKILSEGIAVFFVSGNDLKHIQSRVTDRIQPGLRRNVIIAHCSGSELWGFKENGELLDRPFYSRYDALPDGQKQSWRKIIRQLIDEFHLKTFPAMPIPEFRRITGEDPFSVIFEDRGPQITLDFANSYQLSGEQKRIIGKKITGLADVSDLRIPVMERAGLLLTENKLEITARLAGVFAIDFAVKDVSKETAVRFALSSREILNYIGLDAGISSHPEQIEVWGDKFSAVNGGTDRHISEALPKEVRSITFRKENPREFPAGLNIRVWDGKKELHWGLLEYLKDRKII